MNQGGLAAAVAAATSTDKGEASKVVTVLFELIRDGLKRGEKVAISGFGSFETARREAREGRNPRTGGRCRWQPRPRSSSSPARASRTPSTAGRSRPGRGAAPAAPQATSSPGGSRG